MSNLNQRISEMMKELEKNIENKKDLEYIKNTFSNMFFEFLNDIEKNIDLNNENIIQLEKKQKEFEEKSSNLENLVKKLEKELYLNENYDFEIVCPYCNCEFDTEFDETKTEIKCPECNNIIELDWNEDDDIEEDVEQCDSKNCFGCNGNCCSYNNFEDEDNKKDNKEDDM